MTPERPRRPAGGVSSFSRHRNQARDGDRGHSGFRERLPEQGNNGYMEFLGTLTVKKTLWQSLLLVLFGVAPVITVCACSPSSTDEPPCFPGAYSVSPASAQPGDAVTVASPGADCNPRYGSAAQIQVVVTDESGAKVIDTTAPMTDSGEFTYTFTIPAEMAVGEAAVTAIPYNIDWCDDTGRNNRVDGTVQLELVSCVIPEEPLTITR